jgi:hypothetical protein
MSGSYKYICPNFVSLCTVIITAAKHIIMGMVITMGITTTIIIAQASMLLLS